MIEDMLTKRRRGFLFLAIIIIVLCIGGHGKVGVFASTPLPAFTVVDGGCTAGNEVMIVIELSNNPGLHSVTMELDYEEGLELIKVEDAGLLKGFQSELDYDISPYVLAWEDSFTEAPNTNNGEIVRLTFRVSDDATEGSYDVNLQVREAYRIPYDEEDEFLYFVDVGFQAVSGTITVINELRGDMNRDGLITDADAIYLLYHTFFAEDYPLSQSGDYNGDEVVTDADAIYLLYHTFFPDDYPL